MKIYKTLGAINYLILCYKKHKKGMKQDPYEIVIGFILEQYIWPLDVVDSYLLDHKIAKKINEFADELKEKYSKKKESE